MKKAELILVAVALFAIILRLSHIPGGSFLGIISITFLSMFYFYLSIGLLNGISFRGIFKKNSYVGISGLRIFGSIAAGIVFSIFVIGILFKFMYWPGGATMILAGLIPLSVIVIISLIKVLMGKTAFYRGVLLRGLLFGVLGFVMLSVNELWIVKIQYRDYPEYIEAFEKAHADPDNEELWKEVEAEERKIHGEEQHEEQE